MSFSAGFEWIFFFAAGCYVVYLFSFSKLIFYANSAPKHDSQKKFYSVLICAKNEAHNLNRNLPILLQQTIDAYEVVVVNDQSNDNTCEILNQLKNKFSHLKIYNTKGNSNKKKALALAKDKALGSIYVLTDADCKVNSKNWLKNMVAKLDNQHEVTIGYAPYYQQNTFLNKLQRFETLTTAMQYLTAALYQKPYMGVGRNLAYAKQIDEQINFTKKQQNLLSGDDDLWIQKAKYLTRFRVEIAEESFAYSKPESNFKSWRHQKKRHITTANAYHFTDQLLLSGIFLTKLTFWFGFIWLFFTEINHYVWFVFLSIVSLLIATYKIMCHKLMEKGIWWLAPFLDFSLICFQFSIFISNLVSPIKKWK